MERSERNKKHMTDGIDVYPSANDTLVEMVEGLTPENFVMTMKFLKVKFGINRYKLSEMSGVPYITLRKMTETGIGYRSDQRTKQAIKRLKDALI